MALIRFSPELDPVNALLTLQRELGRVFESPFGFDLGEIVGIVTDRDIVVRVLADGGDPAMVTVGEICSRELTTVPPTASIDDVVRLIREKAIRRLPVVEEDGEVVGIVSIGDIAVARDRESALADVSAALPNT